MIKLSLTGYLALLMNWAFCASASATQELTTSSAIELHASAGSLVYSVRPIPDGVPKLGHASDAETYGYRIPSLLRTAKGTLLAFSERRLGLHDHAQNDIVVKRSVDDGKNWSEESVVHEDGMHSINDPLSLQCSDGRILMMFARFPYGRHARDAGWIRMAELGHDDPEKNVLTFLTESHDDGRTWSEPRDITQQVKPAHWINANCPGAMIQIEQGAHRGRLIAPLWGTVPPGPRTGTWPGNRNRGRTWEIIVAYSDDLGRSWEHTPPLRDPEQGYPNECQVAEAANGDLVLISRNQGGKLFRKKTISSDGGVTWLQLHIDPTLPSVACMGSVTRGPVRADGTWDLYASFPSDKGRQDGRIAVSRDNGRTFEVRWIVAGSFGYSASQLSSDGKSLLCLYETKSVKELRLLSITLEPSTENEVLPPRAPDQAGRPNVVFIACDDMNDWVGFLGGHPDTRTPNMDRLAKRGTVFTRAYCASPICGPSRAAVLTGMKPESTGIYNNLGTYIDYVPDAVSLPRYFRNNGYLVFGAGKINHAMGCVVEENYDEYGPGAGAIGGPFTWEELNMNPGQPVDRNDIAGRSPDGPSGIVKNVYPGKVIERGALSATLPLNGIDNRIDRPANGYNTFDWGAVSVGDDEMPDGQVAAWAESKLRDSYSSPFFLAVGFYRPHQPWYVPAKYFEPFEGEQLALPPALAADLADCGEVARQYAHYPWAGSFATVQKYGQHQAAIRGYLASIHFADAQVGRVLDALDASPHKDNTIVVLWSDHGWQLGEKEHWGKHSPWEGAIRVPLVIVLPGGTAAGPGRTETFASLLDLYPTLAELCGLEVPQELDGESLAAVLDGTAESVRDHIVTTLGRSTFCIRKGDMKLIRYYDGSEELYDLGSDPEEFTNLVADPAQADVLAELRELAPVDAHYKQFVRCGRYKAALTSDDEWQLFDMLHPKSGIGEHTEVSTQEPAVLAAIREYVAKHKVTARYSEMPARSGR